MKLIIIIFLLYLRNEKIHHNFRKINKLADLLGKKWKSNASLFFELNKVDNNKYMSVLQINNFIRIKLLGFLHFFNVSLCRYDAYLYLRNDKLRKMEFILNKIELRYVLSKFTKNSEEKKNLQKVYLKILNEREFTLKIFFSRWLDKQPQIQTSILSQHTNSILMRNKQENYLFENSNKIYKRFMILTFSKFMAEKIQGDNKKTQICLHFRNNNQLLLTKGFNNLLNNSNQVKLYFKSFYLNEFSEILFDKISENIKCIFTQHTESNRKKIFLSLLTRNYAFKLKSAFERLILNKEMFKLLSKRGNQLISQIEKIYILRSNKFFSIFKSYLNEKNKRFACALKNRYFYNVLDKSTVLKKWRDEALKKKEMSKIQRILNLFNLLNDCFFEDINSLFFIENKKHELSKSLAIKRIDNFLKKNDLAHIVLRRFDKNRIKRMSLINPKVLTKKHEATRKKYLKGLLFNLNEKNKKELRYSLSLLKIKIIEGDHVKKINCVRLFSLNKFTIETAFSIWKLNSNIIKNKMIEKNIISLYDILNDIFCSRLKKIFLTPKNEHNINKQRMLSIIKIENYCNSIHNEYLRNSMNSFKENLNRKRNKEKALNFLEKNISNILKKYIFFGFLLKISQKGDLIKKLITYRLSKELAFSKIMFFKKWLSISQQLKENEIAIRILNFCFIVDKQIEINLEDFFNLSKMDSLKEKALKRVFSYHKKHLREILLIWYGKTQIINKTNEQLTFDITKDFDRKNEISTRNFSKLVDNRFTCLWKVLKEEEKIALKLMKKYVNQIIINRGNKIIQSFMHWKVAYLENKQISKLKKVVLFFSFMNEEIGSNLSCLFCRFEDSNNSKEILKMSKLSKCLNRNSNLNQSPKEILKSSLKKWNMITVSITEIENIKNENEFIMSCVKTNLASEKLISNLSKLVTPKLEKSFFKLKQENLIAKHRKTILCEKICFYQKDKLHRVFNLFKLVNYNRKSEVQKDIELLCDNLRNNENNLRNRILKKLIFILGHPLRMAFESIRFWSEIELTKIYCNAIWKWKLSNYEAKSFAKLSSARNNAFHLQTLIEIFDSVKQKFKKSFFNRLSFEIKIKKIKLNLEKFIKRTILRKLKKNENLLFKKQTHIKIVQRISSKLLQSLLKFSFNKIKKDHENKKSIILKFQNRKIKILFILWKKLCNKNFSHLEKIVRFRNTLKKIFFKRMLNNLNITSNSAIYLNRPRNRKENVLRNAKNHKDDALIVNTALSKLIDLYRKSLNYCFRKIYSISEMDKHKNKLKSLFILSSLNVLSEKSKLEFYFKKWKNAKGKRKNLWFSKAINIIAKKCYINNQIAYWRMRDYESDMQKSRYAELKIKFLNYDLEKKIKSILAFRKKFSKFCLGSIRDLLDRLF